MRTIARRGVLGAALLIGGADAIWTGWIFSTTRCSLKETAFLLVQEPPVERLTRQIGPQMSLVKNEAGLDLIQVPQGNYWVVHGDTILPFLVAEQQYDIYEPAGHEVHPGDIVLDCGANIGVFSLKALSHGAGLVIAIEPAPNTLEALRRNLDDGIRSGRVIVIPKGVWDHDDQLELSVNDVNQSSNSVVLPSSGNAKVRVPLTTIDAIVAELNLPRVDFIKMDIEGAEKHAITGAKSTIQRFHPRMSLSSEHLPDDHTAIPALVKSIDPNYRVTGCDCGMVEHRVASRALAFDPLK